MRKSRVNISALNLCRPLTGVGRYIQDISKIRGIDLIAKAPNNNIVVSHDFRIVECGRANSRFLKLIWILKPQLSAYKITHYPQPLLPILDRGKVIVTVHDILFKEIPKDYTRWERILQSIFLRYALKKADLVICVSAYTKESLLRYYSYRGPIEIVYNPVDSRIKRKVKTEKYFLLISNRTKRKNIGNTIEAFGKSKWCKHGYKIIMCGANDGNPGGTNRHYVVDLGFVSNVKLEELYFSAKGLLFFSRGEGFGYPVLESARFGVPVLASDNTSISELFGYRSELLCSDYNSIKGITSFLDKVYDSPEILVDIITQLQMFLDVNKREHFNSRMKEIYSRLSE